MQAHEGEHSRNYFGCGGPKVAAPTGAAPKAHPSAAGAGRAMPLAPNYFGCGPEPAGGADAAESA